MVNKDVHKTCSPDNFTLGQFYKSYNCTFDDGILIIYIKCFLWFAPRYGSVHTAHVKRPLNFDQTDSFFRKFYFRPTQ